MATAFNLEQTLSQIREEFAKKEQIIQTLESQNKLILKMYLNNELQRSECQIPADLRRSSDAVSDGNIIALRRAETNQVYMFNKENGDLLLKITCKYLRCSLVVHKGALITIGGATSKDKMAIRSDELIRYDPTDDQWKESGFPPMPTKRSRTTALTFGHFIIVIGGEDENYQILTTVEILDTTTNQWYTAQDLPDPRCCSSGTIVNGYIYILGGWRGESAVSSVLRCSADHLIQLGTLVIEP